MCAEGFVQVTSSSPDTAHWVGLPIPGCKAAAGPPSRLPLSSHHPPCGTARADTRKSRHQLQCAHMPGHMGRRRQLVCVCVRQGALPGWGSAQSTLARLTACAHPVPASGPASGPGRGLYTCCSFDSYSSPPRQVPTVTPFTGSGQTWPGSRTP